MTSPLPNVLLIGPTGTGKTTSLRTLPKAGFETFVQFTEPHMQVLADIPCSDGLHWRYTPPTTDGWDTILKRAKQLTQFQWASLASMTNDPDKSKYVGFYRLLEGCQNFVCDRCGEEFGDVTEWTTDRAYVVDGLSGLNRMAMQNVAGNPIARTQPMWGCAMDLELEVFASKLTADTKCMYILIGHVRRLLDKVDGAEVKKMPHVLGQANEPDWPKQFNDVVLAVRDGKTWSWSTAALGIDLVGRNLPVGDKLAPDFGPLIERWRKRTQQAEEQ